MVAISMAMWAGRLARVVVLHFSGTSWTSSDSLSWTSSDPSSCCCGATRKTWNYISSPKNPQCGCCWNTLRTNYFVVPTRYSVARPCGTRRNRAPDPFGIRTRNQHRGTHPRHSWCRRSTHRRSSAKGFLVSERDQRS